MSVRLDTYLQAKTPRTPRAVVESSVIATLRGSEPGRVYVMSSHFDDCDGRCTDGAGTAPGADDNGSSVAAVLEAARVMAGTDFRGTIVFACFDGEELGLWGSDHYAREASARHVPILAVLNDDIIGNSVGGDGISEPNVIRVFSQRLAGGSERAPSISSGSENDSPSRELSRFVAETVPVYVPDFTVRQIFRADRFLRGGDQESFKTRVSPPDAVSWKRTKTLPTSIRTSECKMACNTATCRNISTRAYLRRATRANVAALATLALGPPPPAGVRMVLQQSGLRFDPAMESGTGSRGLRMKSCGATDARNGSTRRTSET